MDLSGKRVLVTGASSGIGRAIAVELAARGAELVLIARTKERLEETRALLAGSVHQVIPFDLAKVESIAALPDLARARERKFAGLVHAAGVCPLAPLAATTPMLLCSAMQTNFESFVELCRHFTKRLFFAVGGGSLVAISSVSAKAAWAGGSAYCASKAALDGFVRVLALELAGKQIRVNTVCPSYVKTNMTEMASGAVLGVGGAVRSDDARTDAQPLGNGEGSDIAHVVAFLLSDGARFITGTNLIADGGYLAKGH